MSRPPVPLLLLLAATPALGAVDASAAEFGLQPVPIGAGARALGMGGAFSAVADDASAVTWNPAGLTQCERPEAALSVGWYRNAVQTRDYDERTSTSTDLDHVSGLLPFFAFGCQQVVGVAWQRQFDFGRSIAYHEEFFDPSIPIEGQIDDAKESSGSFATIGASYAIELHPGLSLGLTVNTWGDRWTGASSYDVAAESHTEVTVFGTTTVQDYTVASDLRVISGTSLVLGAFWQASPALTLAAVARPSYVLHLERNATVDSRNDDGLGTITETGWATTSRADLRHPSSLTLGAAWRHGDVHTVSCDTTVTRWSQYRIDDGTDMYSPVSSNLDPEDFGNLWTVRLGYEHVLILPRAIVVPRIGLLLEDLPAATEVDEPGSQHLTGPTKDRWWGATAGLSLVQRRWIWDLGAQVRYGNDVGAGQYVATDQTADMLLTTVRLGLTVQF